MLDFTALDFETANSYRGSPCAVGLVRYRDGNPVDEQRWLIRPPERVDHFDSFNVSLHGIGAQMVRDAPRWRDMLPALVEYIGDDIVVAHNAGFDLGVVRYACAVDGIEWPYIEFLCTMVLSRRALSLPSYRLPFVTDACGFEMQDHHDPLADARAVGRIITILAGRKGVSGVPDLADAHGTCIGLMRSGLYRGCVSTVTGTGGLQFPDVNPDADPDGYLFGRHVVFTGKLMSMTRQEAWDECARAGALAEKTTTKRTNVLVIGDINPEVLRPGCHVTGKARKAFDLQAEGQEIEVMLEDDFVRCLDGGDFDKFSLDGRSAKSPPALSTSTKAATPPQRSAPRPPRPLRRQPSRTDQTCAVAGCENTAAFATRNKPTWCDTHITEILSLGGLRPLEEFTHPQSWRLTECLTCYCVAHYRFVYTLDKNADGQLTCRACYWRAWARDVRSLQGMVAQLDPVPYEDAQALAEENGFSYLGPLTVLHFRMIRTGWSAGAAV